MKPSQPSANRPGGPFSGRDRQFLHLDPDEAISEFPVGQEQVQAYGFVRRSILIYKDFLTIHGIASFLAEDT
jgi:hypothetical protein